MSAVPQNSKPKEVPGKEGTVPVAALLTPSTTHSTSATPVSTTSSTNSQSTSKASVPVSGSGGSKILGLGEEGHQGIFGASGLPGTCSGVFCSAASGGLGRPHGSVETNGTMGSAQGQQRLPMGSSNPDGLGGRGGVKWLVGEVSRLSPQLWPKHMKMQPQRVSNLNDDDDAIPSFLVGTTVLSCFQLRCILDELSMMTPEEREQLMWDGRRQNFVKKDTAIGLTAQAFYNLAPSAGGGGLMPPPPPIYPAYGGTADPNDETDGETTQATPPKKTAGGASTVAPGNKAEAPRKTEKSSACSSAADQTTPAGRKAGGSKDDGSKKAPANAKAQLGGLRNHFLGDPTTLLHPFWD